MRKSGALELSIGTIVIIVLAMSMLILGLVLVKSIFSTGTDVIDMTDDQLKKQIGILFGEKKKLVLYPTSKRIIVKSGKRGEFAVGIQNLLTGADSSEKKFRYSISVAEKGNCPVSERDLDNLIVTGREISPSTLAPGSDPIVRRVSLDVPDGFALCSFTYKVEAYEGQRGYSTDFMDVEIEG